LPNLSLCISYYKNEINSIYSELLFSSSISVFLKLGFIEPKASMIRGSEMKMHNGGRVLLAVLNLYIWIKISVVTFDTNH